MDALSRFAVVPAALAWAVFPGGPAAAAPPPTQVVNAVAVGRNGQPINGFQESPPEANVAEASECNNPSPSAVAANIYYCSPTAVSAGTCWPSTPGSLLCVDSRSEKWLHRVMYSGQLPPVQPPPAPDPYALVLDDGTRCALRNGGAWGGRADGYVGAYGCAGTDPSLRVLVQHDAAPGTCIDKSSPAWTVKVGQLGAPDAQLPPPQTRTVKTAWFAAA
jgi:hypothetical protein